MNSKSTITREELEVLLPEYATGMLDTGLKARVEESLASHPDLQHEADAIRTAFTLVNRDARNTAIDYETRNLSVHVVRALQSQKKRSPLRHLAWLAPAAVATVALVTLNFGDASAPPQVASSNQHAHIPAFTQPDEHVETVVPRNAMQPTDTAILQPTKRSVARRVPTQPLTREEMIVDDLVTDQIVSRMAFETTNDNNETVTGITDEEIDVLLAAVVSNESL